MDLKAIGTDANRGFGGLFLYYYILLYVSKLQVLCKNKQMYVLCSTLVLFVKSFIR